MREIYKNCLLSGEMTDITVEGGKILSVEKTAEAGRDMGGAKIRAGLFDVHAHGCLGFDTMEGHLEEMSRALAARGVTSWLPTTMTMPAEDICRATATLPTADGAKVRGFHLEGPCLAESRKGAQNAAFLRSPEEEDFSAYGHVRMVTLAPELPGATARIRALKEQGIAVALGHTDADYETSLAAFRAGADCLTHTFNAMPPFSHRAPGPVGAALTANGYVQVITDGFHLHPTVVLALYRMFGADRMIIISDMMRATGLADGTFSFGGQEVRVKNGAALLADGTIAGSTTFLSDCVKRAIRFGIPEEDAYKMASETPARMLGIHAGCIRPGYDADFFFEDGDGRFLFSVIGGKPFSA